MRVAGLASRCPKRFRRTTIRSTAPAAEPLDLVRRDFRPTGPNAVWVSDITYVRTWEGWLYLAVILHKIYDGLDEIQQAHSDMEANAATGKLVVRVRHDGHA